MLVKPDASWGLLLSQDQWLHYFVLAVVALGFWLAANLLRGRIGDAMVAASAMGVNVARHKTLAFGISSMCTGVAGGLATVSVQYLAPDGFGIFLSNALLIAVILLTRGGVVGAVWCAGWWAGCADSGPQISMPPSTTANSRDVAAYPGVDPRFLEDGVAWDEREQLQPSTLIVVRACAGHSRQ